MNVVETERLILCPFSIEDLEEYFQIVDDPDIRRYVSFASKNNIGELDELIKCYSEGNFRDDFYFEIREKTTNKIVGSIIATRNMYYSMTLDVCYLIGSKYRGKGYMTEALLGFIRYIYNDISTVYYFLRFEIENENIASKCVMRKCGGKISRDTLKVWNIQLNPLDLL